MKRLDDVLNSLNAAIDDLQMLSLDSKEYEQAFLDALSLLRYVESVKHVTKPVLEESELKH